MAALMKTLGPVLCLALAGCFPNLGGGSSATDASVPKSGTVTQSPGVQNANGQGEQTAPAPKAATTTFDTDKRLEYVDIRVDLGDPNGQRALAPYFLKNDEWMLIKYEMISPTTKQYRFQRVATADGRSLPQVELFKQR